VVALPPSQLPIAGGSMGDWSAYNDFSVDDVFSFRAVFVDVGGCDAHDDYGAGPLHEAGEEKDRAAEGRIASSKLEGHCA
jgi:hypothetical protein